jgi:hypothetical protein
MLRPDAAALTNARLDPHQRRSSRFFQSSIVEEMTFGKGVRMPTETALVVAAIVAVFVMFALVLAWADHYTSKRQPL